MSSALLKLKRFILYGSSFKLRSYERVVLDAWRKHLSLEAGTLIADQLEHLVAYKRLAEGKTLSFWPLKDAAYPGVPDASLLPCRLEECVVARVHLVGSAGAGIQHKMRAEVILHKGRIAGLEFNQPPAKKLARDVEVTKVEILRDPMIPASEETVSDAQRREEVLKTIHSKLPDEYLRLVGESKGVSVNEWDVRAVQDIRKIPQRDGNYYLLAEKEGMGGVGVKEDEFTGQLFYLDQDDNQGEKITVSLRKFFEEFDGGKVIGRF